MATSVLAAQNAIAVDIGLGQFDYQAGHAYGSAYSAFSNYNSPSNGGWSGLPGFDVDYDVSIDGYGRSRNRRDYSAYSDGFDPYSRSGWNPHVADYARETYMGNDDAEGVDEDSGDAADEWNDEAEAENAK